MKSFPQDAEKSTEKCKVEATLILSYWNLIWKKLCDADIRLLHPYLLWAVDWTFLGAEVGFVVLEFSALYLIPYDLNNNQSLLQLWQDHDISIAIQCQPLVARHPPRWVKLKLVSFFVFFFLFFVTVQPCQLSRQVASASHRNFC